MEVSRVREDARLGEGGEGEVDGLARDEAGESRGGKAKTNSEPAARILTPRCETLHISLNDSTRHRTRTAVEVEAGE